VRVPLQNPSGEIPAGPPFKDPFLCYFFIFDDNLPRLVFMPEKKNGLVWRVVNAAPSVSLDPPTFFVLPPKRMWKTQRLWLPPASVDSCLPSSYLQQPPLFPGLQTETKRAGLGMWRSEFQDPPLPNVRFLREQLTNEKQVSSLAL